MNPLQPFFPEPPVCGKLVPNGVRMPNGTQELVMCQNRVAPCLQCKSNWSISCGLHPPEQLTLFCHDCWSRALATHWHGSIRPPMPKQGAK